MCTARWAGKALNTGLQDAYNLAWKLALVVKGRANEMLLDSYEAERLPVARRLLSTTDRAFTMLVSDSWLAGIFRTRIIARIAAFAMTFERAKKLAFRTISQTGIAYEQPAVADARRFTGGSADGGRALSVAATEAAGKRPG